MKSVLVPLANGSEELEAVTILDILRRAGIEAVSASLDGHPVRCSRGTMIVPDTSLDEALKRSFDMVVLPGGQPGTNNLKADARIIKLVQEHGLGRPLCRRHLRRALGAGHGRLARRQARHQFPRFAGRLPRCFAPAASGG